MPRRGYIDRAGHFCVQDKCIQDEPHEQTGPVLWQNLLLTWLFQTFQTFQTFSLDPSTHRATIPIPALSRIYHVIPFTWESDVDFCEVFEFPLMGSGFGKQSKTYLEVILFYTLQFYITEVLVRFQKDNLDTNLPRWEEFVPQGKYSTVWESQRSWNRQSWYIV